VLPNFVVIHQPNSDSLPVTGGPTVQFDEPGALD